MKHFFTLFLLIGAIAVASAQIQMRAVNGSACNRIKIQMRSISGGLVPEHTNDDCQGLPGFGNTINYDITFTLFWTEASITNATDVLALSCPSGGTGYDVRDVGGSGLLDLGGGVMGKGFANGAFTPLDFPESWVLNQWMDITEITLVGFNCELGSITNYVQISSQGMFTEEEDPNMAMNLPDEGLITDYTPEIEGVLPLNLLSFSAKNDGDRSSLLVWSTSDEVNTNYFVIERSTDLVNWEEAGKVQAAGESQSVLQYQYLDLNVYDGRSLSKRFYYRLLIIDKDGRLERSNIEVVKFGSDARGTEVYVFPNPSTHGVNIELQYAKDTAQPAEILMFNNLGQLIYQQVVPEASTIEYIDFSRTNISSGTYTLQVMDQTNGILATEKIVVQR